MPYPRQYIEAFPRRNCEAILRSAVEYRLYWQRRCNSTRIQRVFNRIIISCPLWRHTYAQRLRASTVRASRLIAASFFPLIKFPLAKRRGNADENHGDYARDNPRHEKMDSDYSVPYPRFASSVARFLGTRIETRIFLSFAGVTMWITKKKKKKKEEGKKEHRGH